MDDGVVEDARPVARRGLGRGLGAILPARGIGSLLSPAGPGDDDLAASRGELLRRLDAALVDARRDGSSVTVLVFGLDGFRHVNAEFGHEVGDALLARVAERLARWRRAADAAARLSGDEFALVCPRADALAAGQRVVDRLRAEIERPILVSGNEHRVRPTFGVVVCRPEGPPVSGQDVLGQALAAVHRAKGAGLGWAAALPRAAIEDTTGPVPADAPERLRALDGARPALRYTPLVDLRLGVLVGAQAAAPLVPLLSPVAAVALLLEDITDWARRRSFGPGMRMWVDVDATALLRPDAARAVERALASGGVRPDAAGLVLRGLAGTPVERAAMETMRRLADAGVGLCIEAGAVVTAAAPSLAGLPLTAVVLPAALVDAVATSRPGPTSSATASPVPGYGPAVARAVAGLGRELGLQVFAEGVASEGAVVALAAVGCSHAWGSLYGEPSAAARFADILQAVTSPAPTGPSHP